MISTELRDLIRRMSYANPLWGAPRIHGELLKLGLTVSQATVSKYMVRPRRPPPQAWRTFLKNQVKDLIALDFFTVPTATFRVLFVLVMRASRGRAYPARWGRGYDRPAAMATRHAFRDPRPGNIGRATAGASCQDPS